MLIILLILFQTDIQFSPFLGTESGYLSNDSALSQSASQTRDSILFSNLHQTLVQGLAHDKAYHKLSAHNSFVALLHLCNEKVLN